MKHLELIVYSIEGKKRRREEDAENYDSGKVSNVVIIKSFQYANLN